LFRETFHYAKDAANIDLDIVDFGEHETGNINFYIPYIGPLGGSGTNKKVKVDISRNELLLFRLEERQMFKRYSDHVPTIINCYSLEEIMAEKMRSLLSRQQPRDYYDLWYLSKECGLEMSDYSAEFAKKAKFKGLDSCALENRLEKLLPIFKSRWVGSMTDQIASGI
jgi:hypothetical protein